MNVNTDLFGGGGPQAVCDNLSMQPSLLGQEMGHGYGLDHSRADGSAEDYKDQWDIMSTQAAFMATDPDYGRVGPGMNAWNMRGRGWLDESRVWKGSAAGSETTIDLRPLHRRDLPGFLAAEVGDGYVVEFRVREGWDAAIPRAAVLVHRFEDNHSYIMRGTKGQQDLVAADVFEIGGSKFTLAPHTRVEVLSIDTGTRTATLHIEHRPGEKVPVFVPWPLYSIPRFIGDLVVNGGSETVLGGGLVDGGGWVIVGGKVVRIPSWDPMRKILEQVALFEVSSLAHQPWTRDEIRRAALTAIAAEVEVMTANVNPFRVPAPALEVPQ